MTLNAGGGEEVSTISIESEHKFSNGTETISSSQLEVALKGQKVLQMPNKDEELKKIVQDKVEELR